MRNRLVARMRSLRFSALDFKVGLRMLLRYPGLTLVGTIALAVAIAMGAVYFEAVDKYMNPRLPIRNADSVVSIRSWDMYKVSVEPRLLHDVAIWREQVRTVNDIGVAVVFGRNLITDDGRAESVLGAEVTANAFKLMGTAPLMGRTLAERDEQPAEPSVVVIGHSVWTTVFESDPGVIGRTVQLGTATATIVGVMPAGFAFPTVERIWTPLRVNGSLLAPRSGPAVSVFGRLAPGVSMPEAQAELDIVAARLASTYPETHKNLRARLTTYEKPAFDYGEAVIIKNVMYAVNGVFLMLLVVVSANVATLVFARTTARSWDITVRSALGASRGRITMQLFIEALVLAGVAAVVGLAIARLGMGFALRMNAGSDGLPFWIDASLSWKTMLYTGLLTVVGALIVGVLPALRVTRGNVQDALRSEDARAGLRFGGFWTTVIVVQVAITVAFLPIAVGAVALSNRFQERADGVGADRYISAVVNMDREDHDAESAEFVARGRRTFDELERRLRAEPGVEQVAFADRLPVMDQFEYQFEVDPQADTPPASLRTSTLVQVSLGFFAAFDTSVVAGRDFSPLDFESGRVLIVNQSFARYVFGDRNPVGQRIRIRSGEISSLTGDAWYEIVGMIRDFGWRPPLPDEQAAMYRPRLPAPGTGMSLVVRARDPRTFAARLHAIAAEVNPTLRLTEVQPLADVGGREARMNWALTGVAWLIAFMVLLLSASGIHSLMAFTVARRTREIGIRTALGARPGRIAAGIFSRAFLQIGGGVLVGSALAVLIGRGSLRGVLVLLATNTVMLAVGLAACAVPLRRALTIDPTEALRAEGHVVRSK
jgi:putative ABC transport system permease protein